MLDTVRRTARARTHSTLIENPPGRTEMPLTSTLQERTEAHRADFIAIMQKSARFESGQSPECALLNPILLFPYTALDTTGLCICAHQNGVLPELARPHPPSRLGQNTTCSRSPLLSPKGGTLARINTNYPRSSRIKYVWVRLLLSCLYQIMLKSSPPSLHHLGPQDLSRPHPCVMTKLHLTLRNF